MDTASTNPFCQNTVVWMEESFPHGINEDPVFFYVIDSRIGLMVISLLMWVTLITGAWKLHENLPPSSNLTDWIRSHTLVEFGFGSILSFLAIYGAAVSPDLWDSPEERECVDLNPSLVAMAFCMIMMTACLATTKWIIGGYVTRNMSTDLFSSGLSARVICILSVVCTIGPILCMVFLNVLRYVPTPRMKVCYSSSSVLSPICVLIMSAIVFLVIVAHLYCQRQVIEKTIENNCERYDAIVINKRENGKPREITGTFCGLLTAFIPTTFMFLMTGKSLMEGHDVGYFFSLMLVSCINFFWNILFNRCLSNGRADNLLLQGVRCEES